MKLKLEKYVPWRDRPAEGKTPWFPPSCKPKRPGFYETTINCGALRYFDGVYWRRGRDIVCPPEWRGFVKPNV